MERRGDRATGAPGEIERALRVGATSWWLNAVLTGAAPGDVAADHLPGLVVFPDGERVSWLGAVGRLRTTGVAGVNTRVTEPGDPAGLPGPAEVTRAALAAGSVLTTDDSRLVIVPTAGGHWGCLPASATPGEPLGTLAEARSLMRTAMAELSAEFSGLDPDDEALASVAALRDLQDPVPPPGLEPRSVDVAATAVRVWWMTRIAAELSVRRGLTCPAPVRGLGPLSRRALSVAFSR